MGFLGRLGEGIGILGSFAPGAGTGLAAAGAALSQLDAPGSGDAPVAHPYAGSYDYREPFRPGGLLYGFPSDLAEPYERRSWIVDPLPALSLARGFLLDASDIHRENGRRAWAAERLGQVGEWERVGATWTLGDVGPITSEFSAPNLPLGLRLFLHGRGWDHVLLRTRFDYSGGGPQLDYTTADHALGIYQRWQARLADPPADPVFWWIDNRPLSQRAPEIAARALSAPGMLRTANATYADVAPDPADELVLSKVTWDAALELALSSSAEPWSSARAAERAALEQAQAAYDEELVRWQGIKHAAELARQTANAQAILGSAYTAASQLVDAGALAPASFWPYVLSTIQANLSPPEKPSMAGPYYEDSAAPGLEGTASSAPVGGLPTASGEGPDELGITVVPTAADAGPPGISPIVIAAAALAFLVLK